MLLNKLESGFLLLQTQQGFVAVEPSTFWQRVYLLWTFRNFRELSPLLLNARQTALINDLFRRHATVISHEYDPSLQIGVVEDFVPLAIEVGAALSVKTCASPAAKARLPEPTVGPSVAPSVIPEDAVIDRTEIAPDDVPDRAFATGISGLSFGLSDPTASRPRVSRILIFRFAAAMGALSLCAGFIAGFHRTGAIPASRAHSSPPQLNSRDSRSKRGPTSVAENPDAGKGQESSSAPGPTSVAENPVAVPEEASQADAVPDAPVKPAKVKPAPGKIASPIPTTHPMTKPEPAFRGTTARLASRSSGGFHAVAFSRVSAWTSTRRAAWAPGARGATASSAQRYFHLADQQMHERNYTAAAANYKRAWRIEQNRAAAKGRMVRRARAMQAKNESIAPLH